MSKKRLVLSMMLAMTMVSFGLGDSLRLTEIDNGRTNSVNAGSEIKIVLEGNPTTGYSWDVASFSTNRLQQIGAVAYLPFFARKMTALASQGSAKIASQSEQPGEKQRVGVGGKFMFRFKAVVSGQGHVKLIYRRSWETNSSDKTYSVIFEIR